MTLIVARKKETEPVQIDKSMTLWRLVGKESPALDFVWARIDGEHGRFLNRRSTKLYYVASGELTLTTDETITLGEGDIGIVPPGTSHRVSARTAEVGIACTPAFDPNDEEKEA